MSYAKVGEILAANYLKTAENMYESSKILHSNKQYSVSCYLAGYVVECAFNSILKTIHVKDGNTSESFPKAHLNEHGYKDKENCNDPALVIGNPMFKMCLIQYPELAKYDFFNSSSRDYPKTIINGSKKWNNSYRYDQDIWNSHDISEQFQKEIDIIKGYIDDLKSKGLMKE